MRPPIDLPPINPAFPRNGPWLRAVETTALFSVEEVEREHIDAAGGETVGKLSDEATVLAGAGPMRQHERRLHSVLSGRSVSERARASVFADVDRQPFRHALLVS